MTLSRCDATSPLGAALSATSWIDVHLAPHFPSNHKEVMMMMMVIVMVVVMMEMRSGRVKVHTLVSSHQQCGIQFEGRI